MPRSQGTSRKGKPKKTERAAGMGRALERSQKKRYKPKMNGASRGPGGMQATGAASIGIDYDAEGPGTRSVLELDDLADFIGQAEMANREFVSERERFVVLDSAGVEYRPEGSAQGGANTDRPSGIKWADDTKGGVGASAPSKASDDFRFKELSVPRRPAWDENTTPDELRDAENKSFLDWRRAIARREEQIAATGGSTAVTPFEKNLEVWRQLWRVLERSDCIVQILDARNPMFYLSQDLRKYACEELGKPMIVLVNKSDYLTARQRKAWHEYLAGKDIEHIFFSAYEEQKKLDEEARQARVGEEDESEDNEEAEQEKAEHSANEAKEDTTKDNSGAGNSSSTDPVDIYGVKTPLTRAQLLEALPAFASRHDIVANEEHNGGKVQFGMVGFPNVGKSSVINVLAGVSKHTHGLVRVGVAAQPGKTRHFQTLHLPDRDDVLLCDCPGLVFPSFVSSTADLIAAGVYPIAQMRDHWPVVEIICKRIPREVLNAHYGIKLPVPSMQDLRERGLAEPHQAVSSGTSVVTAGGTRLPPPTAEELLGTYCIARSLLAAASGVPDYQRASRVVIKDYTEGKLIYCHPPPGLGVIDNFDGRRVESNADYQRETLVTALRNTKKLKDKLGLEAELLLEEKKEASPADDEDAVADDFDDLDIEDDLDLLDMVAGIASEDGVPQAPGGKRGKAHKKINKHGKKGRKDRNKDPYGCHSSDGDPDILASAGGGLIVNSGAFGAHSGYTRGGVNHQGGKKHRKRHAL